MTVEQKIAKLSDVNLMDVTIKELVEFLDELKGEMPHVFRLIMHKFSNELRCEADEQEPKAFILR
jgi:hypothetical protein